MTPLYLEEMEALKHTDTLIWEEFQIGNWVFNKRLILFCAIGAGHALESWHESHWWFSWHNFEN